MEIQNQWICKNKVIENHHLARVNMNCLVPLDDLFTREGQVCTLFGDDYRVLDMDEVERKSAARESRSPNATVDCVMGLVEGKIEKVLLVECRFRYKNVNNISQSDLDNKVRYSAGVLGNVPVQCRPVYFLFTSSVAPVANRKIRQFKNNRRDYVGVDVTQFYNLFSR